MLHHYLFGYLSFFLLFYYYETDDHPNPQDLSIVAEEIAKLKQISVEKLITQCDNNAISLFRLS
jgi:TatD DNase family protein